MKPDAVIRVGGDPEDGQNDTIDRFELEVDGVPDDQVDDTVITWQLPARHDEPKELESPFSPREGLEVTEVERPLFDPSGQLQQVWKHYRLTFTDLDLEFDLKREDLLRSGTRHELRVEARAADTAPGEHRVNPVYLRQEKVEVIDPELATPLEDEDRVAMEGRSGDGEPENYPLVVILDHIDDAVLENLVLEVSVDDTDLEYSSNQWERLEEGRFRVVRDVEVDDFPDDEEPVEVSARLVLPDDVEVTYAATPTGVLSPGGCTAITGADVGSAFGRQFGPVIDGSEMVGFFADGFCSWDAARSQVQVTVFADGTADGLRADVAAGADDAVDGFGDAARYDLISGNALDPSGIRGPDGEMQWTNFVNLTVAVNSRQVIVHVQGNVVVEEGPETGLLDRLRDFVEILRQRL
jgi:hypothetical protein